MDQLMNLKDLDSSGYTDMLDSISHSKNNMLILKKYII